MRICTSASSWPLTCENNGPQTGMSDHFTARIWRGRLYRFLLDFFGLGLRFARNDRKGKNGPRQASSAENICHHAWPPSIGTEILVESRVVIGQQQHFLNETLLMQGLRFSRHPCQ